MKRTDSQATMDAARDDPEGKLRAAALAEWSSAQERANDLLGPWGYDRRGWMTNVLWPTAGLRVTRTMPMPVFEASTVSAPATWEAIAKEGPRWDPMAKYELISTVSKT